MFSSICSRTLMQNSFGFNYQSKTSVIASLIQRGITTATVDMNHYKALGLSSAATQNDIKSAYYKLSMIYHPDKNKGNESAANKFREIAAAYEVLGNLRLRKLYDKGIIQMAGPHYASSEPEFEEEVEDDPQTKFYKAREKRTQVPNVQGKTPIYNFDEWSRAHYGSAFERKQKARQRYEFKETQKKEFKLKGQNEVLIFVILAIITIINLFMMKDYDQNRIKKKEEDKK